MYCTNCGQALRESGKFCQNCGKPAEGGQPPRTNWPPLERAREGKKIAGVCAGFARHLGMDVTLVRIAWLLIALTAGVGFIAYIVAWIAMPLESAPAGLYANSHGHPVPNG